MCCQKRRGIKGRAKTEVKREATGQMVKHHGLLLCMKTAVCPQCPPQIIICSRTDPCIHLEHKFQHIIGRIHFLNHIWQMKWITMTISLPCSGLLGNIEPWHSYRCMSKSTQVQFEALLLYYFPFLLRWRQIYYFITFTAHYKKLS